MAGRNARFSGPPSGAKGEPHQQIQAYGGGAFRVSGVRHEGSILVFADRTEAWAADTVEAISAASLAPLSEDIPAAGAARTAVLVVIGCGERFTPMPPTLRAELAKAGIHAEWMDTGAACRTFNVLVGEGRAVRAALLAVD